MEIDIETRLLSKCQHIWEENPSISMS